MCANCFNVKNNNSAILASSEGKSREDTERLKVKDIGHY